MDDVKIIQQDVNVARGAPGLNFSLGMFLGFLISMFVILIIMFSAYYQPDQFGGTYREIFCSGLKPTS
jgi:hypothetical protein